jgi:mannose/fructose-specific phosphotransferase system component IIA
MSVGLVIVTHGTSGESLIAESEFILGHSLENVHFVAFDQSAGEPGELIEIHGAIAAADTGDGVLVLTDLMGSTPSNRVSALLEHFDAVMVTGINLAMLVCVYSYRDLPLGALARKAVECGRKAVKIFQK